MAALICARLASFVLHTLRPIYPALRVKLWSDTKIVLHWPHSNKPLIPFVTNRTEVIKNLFPTSDWNHCPTSVNPADLLTRGINAEQLQVSSLWKCGPQWLPSESHWPTWTPAQTLYSQLFGTVVAETVKEQPVQTVQKEKPGVHRAIDVFRYSMLAKLLGITAYILRFV